jgi:hypothetical protein
VLLAIQYGAMRRQGGFIGQHHVMR